MVKISNLTELTATASADKVAVDDASASQTKYVSIKNLTGHGYAQLQRLSTEEGGSTVGSGTITSYSNLTFNGEGETGGASTDSASAITLPSTGGLFFIRYFLNVLPSNTDEFYFRLYDGSAAVAGSTAQVTGVASTYRNVSGGAIYSSSGSETISLQAKCSVNGTLTINGMVITVTPIPASA